jgi:hypothetical protein
MTMFLLGFLALALTLLFALAYLQLASHDSRRPFSADYLLLREPGHSLRLKITALDRAIIQQTLAALLGAVVPLMGLSSQWTGGPAAPSVPLAPWGFLLLLLVTLGLALAAITTYARRRRDLALGLFGERVVAEHLEPLKALGHRILHDLPCDEQPAGSTPRTSNIDHVVIGPAGIYAIETKTRRQSRARVGFMAHEIIYDGRALAFPWGEDQHGLEQARRNAEWLATFLEAALGRAIPVHPLLVFPGWSIIRKGAGPVHVLHPAELPDTLSPSPSTPPTLDPATREQIIHLLAQRCRETDP